MADDNFRVGPNFQWSDPKTGLLTREAQLLVASLVRQIQDETSDFVLLTATQTVTNKTLTSPVINGGTITGITDLAVADGGTGASNAAGARTNLGLVIGTDVQAHDTDLDAWAGKTAPSGTVVGTSDTQNLSNKAFTNPPVLPTYTVATVPNVATFARGLIYVSDEAGGPVPAFSDGTDWRRFTDRAVVS